MADDKTFRPQRKNVTASDIEGTSPLESVQNVRDQLSNQAGNPMESPGAPSLEVTGTIPPAFQKALQQQRNQEPMEYQEEYQSQEPRMKTRQRPQSPQNVRVTGSSTLEDLLGRLKPQSVYDEIVLPSLGKFYNGEDGPTSGILHVKPMTGSEEQILATPRYVKKGKAIDMIFNRCIQEDFDPSKLLTADRTYLLIYLRGISYTPKYDVEVKCPFTDKNFNYEINLDTLYVDECPPDFNEDSLHGTLPMSGFNFSYRLSRGEDEQKVTEYRDMKAKFDISSQADDTLLYRTALLVTEIEGLTNHLEIQTLLQKLPIADVAHLRNLVNEPPFGVDTTVEIISPFSSEEFEIELPLEANFFFPRAKKTTRNTTHQ